MEERKEEWKGRRVKRKERLQRHNLGKSLQGGGDKRNSMEIGDGGGISEL